MLTFEVYTNEQQRLIQRQDAHISYLQTKYAQRGPLVSQSPAMATVARAIELVVTTPVTVLIEGETGTGKDVIATTIHQLSNRSKKPFVTVNCGAIPRDLIETELFGHEKGSFTGAERTHIGKFELAHEGTLFLDEIGELPLDLQVKLLRALQNQEIQRVGSTDPISVDVRIIAATNKSLQTEVNLGRFREDLFYRLNVYPIQMPALRQRSEDILPLAHQFLAEASKRFGIPAGVLSDDASHYLLTHNWPGNIRELENVMQRALILAQGGVITASTLTLRPGQIETPLPLLPAAAIPISSTDIIPLEATEAQAIARALKVKNGNILQAARALNISRTTLYAKAKKHGIEL
ncbi:sigma-54-dependent Fis family transcriptional regulator [bacterium]|nr:sigma-54-dependent Fis family transcriptional regulator [bacterium]